MYFHIGDKVKIDNSDKIYTIIGIQVLTYIGMRGNVSTDYILYLGNGLWRSASAVVEYKKNR